MSVGKDHDILGHPSEAKTRETAKVLGWILTRGALIPCRACSTAKAKQKNVPNVSEHILHKEAMEESIWIHC